MVAGATHGYAKHRWPEDMGRDYLGYPVDKNNETRKVVATFWPFYWMFIWPFTKTNETVFNHIETEAAHKIAKNKSRIEDIKATREQVEASNKELEAAQIALEEEMEKYNNVSQEQKL